MTTNITRSSVNESDVVCVVTMPNNQSSSLLHAADKIGSCDDLTTQIMLRLPVISLIRFKSVSKHWYSLISNPTFNQLFQNRNPNPPPSGLYALVNTKSRKLEVYFIPFNIENRSRAPNLILNFDPDDKGTIVDSCNGLMLCCGRWDSNDCNWASRAINCYVYNPTINQFTKLPKHEIFITNYICGMTLVYDPSKSPYYKIVSIRYGRDNYTIGIYNSQTYTWKDSCICNYVYDCNHMNISPGVYWNNAVHWLLGKNYLFYFSLDEEVVRILRTSFGLASSNKMFESRDHLLVVETDSTIHSKLKIHELKRDYSGWFVKYHVDLHQLGQSFPEAVHPNTSFLSKLRVLYVVLSEREDESFVVLKIAGVFVRFNLVVETFYKLHYTIASTKVFLQYPYAFQFIASLCSV